MDMNSREASPVIVDHTPINKSRLGISSSLLPYSQSGPSFSASVDAVPRKKHGKLDDVLSNGWLDAMKSSSPPRKKVFNEINDVDLVSDDTEVSYKSWMIRYPSALNSFKTIMDRTRNRKLVIFLDYDGTLSPIVDDPDRAFMSTDMRSVVRSVAKYFPTAIISGRSRDKVYDLVGLRELYYAGSHGMDIMFPTRETLQNHLHYVKSTNVEGDEINLFQPASEFIPMINQVYRTLVETTKDIIGARVENHKFCASVHYRNVDENSWPVIGQYVHDILKDYPRLRITHGRKVLEVRPVIDWDKGKAVEFLLESLGFCDYHDVLPIYIGDDMTDEDAFRALRKGNKRGYGILVSAIPKESNAFFSLRDTSEVQYFLESLVRMAEDAKTLERNTIVNYTDES